jgi:hypothetical protein
MSDIVVYQPSANTQLSTALLGIEASLENAAKANVANIGEGFTQAEKHAMTVVEELKLINGMDLAAMLLRGKLIKQIEDEALYSIHPGRYGSMEELARDQGIGPSELSNVRDLCFTIFPYMEQRLGISIAQVWEQIGKSNFRELVPVLKVLINGDGGASASVRNSVERILDDVVITAHASGQNPSDEEMRSQAVQNLLEAGATMTNRDLRQTIRPEHTASLEPVIFNRNGTKLLLVKVSDDQWQMLQHRLQGYMDPIFRDLPNDRGAAQIEMFRVPIVREFTGFMGI